MRAEAYQVFWIKKSFSTCLKKTCNDILWRNSFCNLFKLQYTSHTGVRGKQSSRRVCAHFLKTLSVSFIWFHPPPEMGDLWFMIKKNRALKAQIYDLKIFIQKTNIGAIIFQYRAEWQELSWRQNFCWNYIKHCYHIINSDLPLATRNLKLNQCDWRTAHQSCDQSDWMKLTRSRWDAEHRGYTQYKSTLTTN